MSAMLADDPRVTALRAQLTSDLRVMIKARDANGVAAIRTLLARLDQASAIPLEVEHLPVLGEATEVSRRYLTWDEAGVLVLHEIEEKRRAIATFEKLELTAEVERLTRQLDLMQSYHDQAR